MGGLTLQLEELFAEEKAYVLWGVYQDMPQYEEHAFPIHGSACGHLPVVSLRSEILKNAVADEWIFDGVEYLHRSGLSSSSNVSHEMDVSAFHPSTISLEIKALLSMLPSTERVCSARRQRAIPLLRWTFIEESKRDPVTPQQQRGSPLARLAQRVL
ncbi:MAG: hypothetical protein ACFHXK_05630 [bacterium]